MTASQLKASILDLAIRGKLVAQDPADEPAAKLLERIREKVKVKGEGEQRKRASRSPAAAPIADDEKPFDLPDGWAWVRLGEVVFNHGQKQPCEKFCYIDIGSIDNDHQCLNASETILEPKQASSRARKIVHKGDVIYSCVRPYLHNVAIIDRDFSLEPIASTGFAVMATPSDCLLNKYLFYYLLSPTFDDYANDGSNAKGIAYPAISDSRLYAAAIPLPPLAEQARIVARVEELLPMVEEYGAAFERRRKMVGELPEKLRKSILQRAIEGKLVAQDPDDEPASELLARIREKVKVKGEGEQRKRSSHSTAAAPITDDEKPFDLPNGWAWVRFSTIADISTGPFGSMLHKSDYVDGDTSIPLVNPTNIKDGKIVPLSKMKVSRITADRLASYKMKHGQIVMARRGEAGRCAVVEKCQEGWLCGTGSFFFSTAAFADPYYVTLCFTTEYVKNYLVGNSVGSTMFNLNHSILKRLLLPLPPLAEQKRIVAKVESLLADVERLKQSTEA